MTRFFAVTALLIPLTLFGQTGFIKGRVTDAGTGEPLAGVNIVVVGTRLGATTETGGWFFMLAMHPGFYSLKTSYIGYQAKTIDSVQVTAGDTIRVDIQMNAMSITGQEVVVTGQRPFINKTITSSAQIFSQEVITSGITNGSPASSAGFMPPPASVRVTTAPRQWNTEEYKNFEDNPFLEARSNPLSTFSIDVDVASYTNIRRFIQDGQAPPPDAVRTEEMINYFTYTYPQPTDEHPFSINTQLSACPWSPEHRLLCIGLQGKKIPTETLPPSNLVFLLDISGSMDEPNKLPLVQASMRLLVRQLRPVDVVSIVVYAGTTGIALPPTHGNDKTKILAAIDNLASGGSTAGGAGILLAYKTAQESFMPKGNNRIVWATDGDFNTGISSTSEMVRLVEEKRQEGVYLSMLGFGMGNLKDSRMEEMADKGNGNYAYIDNFTEARRVLVGQMAGTLFTIAKDVKIQIEFNPQRVQAYRLIGYENRLLAKEDFNNDKKDAGELGSGHSVTALYEIVPPGVKFTNPGTDSLKYQMVGLNESAANSGELATVKLRYKPPTDTTSKLLTRVIQDEPLPAEKASIDFQFASAVAEFAMLLRNSPFKASASYDAVARRAKQSLGDDPEGYRAEFIRLVKSAEALPGPQQE